MYSSHVVLFLFLRSSLTKVLNEIKEKKHDYDVCFSNCQKNGEAFNTVPHQCTYHTGSPRYNNLLAYPEVPDVDASDGGTSANPNIKEFCLQLIMLEDYLEDVEFGFRKEEDVVEVENTIENL